MEQQINNLNPNHYNHHLNFTTTSYHNNTNNTTNNNHHNNNNDYHYHYYHHDDDEKIVTFSDGQEAYTWIVIFAILPISFLGLITNTLSLRAWNSISSTSSSSSSSMILLFQYLAILDNTFLLASALRGVLYCVGWLTPDAQLYLFPALFFSQTMAAHATVMIGISRWWLLTRGRLERRAVTVACGVVGGWCVVLTVAEMVMVTRAELDALGVELVVKEVGVQFLAYVLPNLVLLVFSALLLRLTFQRQRYHTSTSNTTTTKKKKKQQKRRRMTMAVLSIATCSFLACPVAITGQLVGVLAPNRDQGVCDWVCAFVTFGVGEVLQVFNSSVNLFFYVMFSASFRPLLRRALRCPCSCYCHCCHRRPHSAAFTTAPSSTRTSSLDLSSATQSSSLQHHHHHQQLQQQEQEQQQDAAALEVYQEEAGREDTFEEATTCL